MVPLLQTKTKTKKVKRIGGGRSYPHFLGKVLTFLSPKLHCKMWILSNPTMSLTSNMYLNVNELWMFKSFPILYYNFQNQINIVWVQLRLILDHLVTPWTVDECYYITITVTYKQSRDQFPFLRLTMICQQSQTQLESDYIFQSMFVSFSEDGFCFQSSKLVFTRLPFIICGNLKFN